MTTLRLVSEKWETRSLPRRDGRSYVTAEMMLDQPHIGEMVRRTPDAWKTLWGADTWIAKEPGEIPVRFCVREWDVEDDA